MKKKNLKSTMLCLALSLSLVTGMSFASLAGTGSVSFGGMTASWGLYSSYMSTTVTYTSPAILDATGYINQRHNSYGFDVMKYCTGFAASSKKLSFSSYPDAYYSFQNSGIAQYQHYMDVSINGVKITTYHPTV